jgi:drug/metabolite transporter (DMT)-like permease
VAHSASARDVVRILLVAGLWGASFLFIRVAAPAFGPLTLVAARTGVAGCLLLAVVFWLRRAPRAPSRADGPGYLLLGLTSAAVPFTLIAYAELHLPASMAAVLNATTPLFAALLTAIVTRQRPGPLRVTGIVAAIGGVAIVVGLGPVTLTSRTIPAVAASLGAAVSYAVGGIYAQRRFAAVPPLTVATGQQLGAAVILLIPAAVFHPAASPRPAVWASLLALSVLCTAAGFAIFYQLLASVGATGALSVTFLVPVFGIIWAGLFLHEAVTAKLIIGLVVILAGLYLLLGPDRRRSAAR